MKVGDLVRFAPNCERAWHVPNAKVGIVKEKHSTEPIVYVFWTRKWTTGEWEYDLEVIHESRRLGKVQERDRVRWESFFDCENRDGRHKPESVDLS